MILDILRKQWMSAVDKRVSRIHDFRNTRIPPTYPLPRYC